MNKAAFLLMMLFLVPAQASASPLRLTFHDCGGPSHASWTCTSNLGVAFTLFGYIEVPALTSLIGAESIIDFGFNGGLVPEWWRIGAGLCRPATRMSVTHDSPGSACVDHFGAFGAHATTSCSYVVGPATVAGDPFGPIPAWRARLYVSTVLDSAAAATAGAPREFDAVLLFVIVMRKGEVIPPEACTGCANGPCVSFLQTRLRQPVGLGDHVTQYTALDGYSCVTTQGGSREPCYCVYPDAATPSTWGQVKSLYR